MDPLEQERPGGKNTHPFSIHLLVTGVLRGLGYIIFHEETPEMNDSRLDPNAREI